MLVGNVNFVEGGEGDIPAVLALLEQSGIDIVRNPDLYRRTYRVFGIDEARDLSDRASRRAIGKRRVFLIAADVMTAEAQNALLKTLEEAPGDALFVFLHPAPETLLPTVKSRATIIRLRNVGHAVSNIDVDVFLKAAPTKRLDMLKPLLEKGDEDTRDIGAIIRFLSALERTLAAKPESLLAVYRARKYVTDRGALVKPLLEQVALLI